MTCSPRYLLALLSALTLAPLGIASAQGPITFRTPNGTEFTDSTQVIVADVCLESLSDTTIYFRQTKGFWDPISVTDGLAPNCSGSGYAWQIEGNLREGTNYLVVEVVGPYSIVYRDSVSLILLVEPPPGGGPFGVPAVTAPAPAGISLPPGQVHVLPFVVTNASGSAGQFTGVLECSGAVTGCTSSGQTTISTDTLAAGGAQTFQVSVTPSAVGGNGLIRLIATGTAVDTGTTIVGVGRPPLAPLLVTRMADTIQRPASSASVAYFRIWNPDAFATRAAALTLFCDAMTNCTATPSAPSLAPMSEVLVRVNFTSPSSDNKRLRLTATANDGPAAGKDSVWVKTGTALSPSIVVSAHEPTPRSSVSRGACLSVAAGPGAGVECGALRLAYSFSSVRSMNKERALRLVYLSQHATPAQTIPVRVWIKARTDSVNLVSTLTVASHVITRTVAWNPACAMAAGCVLNVPLNADSLNLATRDYAYTVSVKLADAPSVIGSINGTVIVVNRKNSEFGSGWWIEGLETLMPAGTNSAHRLWLGGDGSARVFVPTSGGWYAPKDTVDRPERLQRTVNGSDTTWVRHLRNGATVTFDNAYRHVATTNREGHVTRFAYPSATSSRLIRVMPPVPGAVDSVPYYLHYDSTLGAPRLRSVWAPAHDAHLIYTLLTDADRRILAFAEPIGDSVKFTYSGASRLPTSRIDRMGQPVLYEYTQGYVTRVKTAYNHGGTSDTIATRFCAAEGRTLFTCAIDGTAVAAIPSGRFVSRLDGPLSTGGLQDVTRFHVGRYGAVDTIVDAYGGTTSVTRGNVSFPLLATKVIDPAGVETHATYSSRGLPTTLRTVNAWSPGSSDTTLVTWHTTWDMVTETRDPTGVLTRFGIDSLTGNRLWHQVGTGDSSKTFVAYDGLNRPTVVSALSPTGIDTLSRFEYSAVSGNVLTAISATGQRTRFSMYKNGRVYETRTTLSDTTWESGGAVLRQRFVFDSAWRVRIDSTIAPARNWSIDHYSLNLSGTTAALSAIVTTEYDKEGRPLSVTRKTSGTGYAGELATSYFGYDNLGRQRATWTTGSSADSTEYDLGGRPVRMRTRTGHVVNQSFDLLGRLLTRTTSEVRQAQAFCSDCDVGQEAQYLVRIPYFSTPLTSTYSSPDVVIPVETTVFGYDQFGRMIQADNEHARIRRSYFANGALKSDSTGLRLYSSTASDPVFGSQHITGLSFTYDRAGRRLSRTDTWGRQTYAYNGLGELTQTRDSTGASGVAAPVNFAYDARGRLQSQSVPGAGLSESWQYDAADLPIVRSGTMGETVEYDIRGKRIAVNGTMDVATGATFAMVAAYDAFGHLVATGTQGVGVNATDEYFPDAFGNSSKRYGNRMQALSVPETAERSNFAASRMVSTSLISHPDEPTRTGPDGGPPVQAYNALDIQHDGAGNVLNQASVHWTWVSLGPGGYGEWRIAPSGHTWTWTTYDANNRARVIQNHVRGSTPAPPQTTTTEMWYDALGRRVLMRFRTDSTSCYNPPVDSTLVACQQAITRFSWDGDQLLREQRTPGGWQLALSALDGTPQPGTWYGTRRYTQTGAIDTPLLLWWNDLAPRAIARNWRGSAAGALLVSSGQSDGLSYPAARVSVQYELDSRMSAPAPTAWLGGLIDEQRDPTGLLYRRNRYYDPQTGRFTQEDPIGLAGGMNLYGYAGGDPVNYHDPFGLCPDSLSKEEAEECQKKEAAEAERREQAIATCKADAKQLAITTAMWVTGLGALKYAGHAKALVKGAAALEADAFAGFMLNSTLLGTTATVRAANMSAGGTNYGLDGAVGVAYNAAKFFPTPVASGLELGETINSCIAAAQTKPE